MKSNRRSRLPYLILVFVILLIDRISKSAISARFELGQPIPIIDGAFNITYVQNTGVAFGLLSAFISPIKALFLSLVAATAATVVVIFSLRNSPRNRWLQIALGLILAGALGNLY